MTPPPTYQHSRSSQHPVTLPLSPAPPSKMDAPYEQYAILSVCGAPGTLHLHRPRDSTPRHAQTLCHPRLPVSSAATSKTLITLSHPPSSSTASLTHHLLSRPAGASSRRTAAPEPLVCLALSPTHTLLAASGPSGRLFLWHLPSGLLLSSFCVDVSGVSALCFTDDSHSLLVATSDASIALFDTATLADMTRPPADDPAPVARLVGHALPITAVATGASGAAGRAVSIAADRALRVWHIASATCLATILLSSPPQALAFTRDESVAFIGGADGSVVAIPIASLPFDVTRSADGFPTAPAPTIGKGVSAIALSPKEDELVVGYVDGVVRVLDAASLAIVHVYVKHGITSPITVVHTMPTVPEGVEECMPLQRARDDEVVEEYAPSVDVGFGEDDVANTVWESIESVERMAFGEWVDMAEKKTDQSGAMNDEEKGCRATESDLMTAELTKEVEFLRKRNKELEDAGKRLIDIIDEREAGLVT